METATSAIAHRCRVYSHAMGIVADNIPTKVSKLPLTSMLVFVGHSIHKGVRITARLLGPTRIDGGLLLLTEVAEGRDPSHRAYLLDDLQHELRTSSRYCEHAHELALINRAIARRNQILSTTTNYFSGITGKVWKIL